ncbi:hypothetical protein [Luteolibacter soli]|uniref:Uncharacterized protein n=1 Tax=Luteolibacter soli TaxID=3135280 RepID=A0ABU9AVD2_9BACT
MKGVLLTGWVWAAAVGMMMPMGARAGERVEWIHSVTMEEVKTADVAVEFVGGKDGRYVVKQAWRGNGKGLELLFEVMWRLGMRSDGYGRSFLYLHWEGTPLLGALRTKRMPEISYGMPRGLDRRQYVLMAGTGKERYFFDYRVMLVGKDEWKPTPGRAFW